MGEGLKLTLDFNGIYSSLLGSFVGVMRRFGIGHLLLISLSLHMFAMCFPNNGGMVFDEVHYIKATRAHMEGIGANAEHTPLVKVVMSVVFSLFGDYWFAWRFPIVASCMITYLAFYYVAKHFLSERYALLATGFLCFDILFFIHGTIYLLDMPAIMFAMVGIALYFYKRYYLSAFSFALAILSKEISFLMFVGFALYVISSKILRRVFKTDRGNNKEKRRSWRSPKKQSTENNEKRANGKSTIKLVTIYMIVLVMTGVLFSQVYVSIYEVSASAVVIHKDIVETVFTDEDGNAISTSTTTKVTTDQKFSSGVIEYFSHFWRYHTDWMTELNMTYRAFQKPWNWIAPIDLNGIFDHPVYFRVTVSGSKTYHSINYRAQGTLPIWYSIWIIVPAALFYLVKKKETELSVFILSWIIATYGLFVVLEIVKKSTGFNYYFIYTIPVLCLGISYFWSMLEVSERIKFIGVAIHFISVICFFAAFFPIGVFR